VSVPDEAHAGKRDAPARFEIDLGEAEIVRRIFRVYAAGQSMKAIAHQLNADGVPFPAKDTKRGPVRRGWAISTIYTILLNEKYIGVWVWNKTRFLKDPDSGRRRPVPRPQVEWIRHDRPQLRIVDDELWRAVQSRLRQIRQGFGRPGGPPNGGALPMYSRYLLTGLVRCALCGARMRAQTAVKRKRDRVYRAGWYRCSFAADKGPTVWLQGLRAELAELEHEAGLNLPRASPGWIQARLEHLDTLLRDDAPRARLEILKHLDGDLTIHPLASQAPTTECARGAGHAFEIRGRIKHDSLLAVNQEAACATLVAGAGFEPTAFGL